MRPKARSLVVLGVAALSMSMLSACGPCEEGDTPGTCLPTEPETPPDSAGFAASPMGTSAIRVVWSAGAGAALPEPTDGEGTGASPVTEPLS
jgi:hypothetical protein